MVLYCLIHTLSAKYSGREAPTQKMGSVGRVGRVSRVGVKKFLAVCLKCSFISKLMFAVIIGASEDSIARVLYDQ